MKSEAGIPTRNLFLSRFLIPWFCLGATLIPKVVFANEGLDDYRQGNYIKAAEVFGSAPVNDPVVDYYTARMRLYGYGQLKNNSTALRYFQKAAEKGFLPAQDIMARYTLLKEKNPEKALYWFKLAADANDVQAQMYCAAAYLFGVGTKKNPDMARRYYIAAARNGNSIAQYALADQFLDSKQLASKKLGLIWLNKAVAQNNPAAQLKLAELYRTGTLVPQDLAQAKTLIDQAIAAGYAPALYQMGELFRQQNDFVQAKEWYTKAVEAHYKPAEIAIAGLYTQEKSPMYDLNQGFLVMLKAAQNGSPEAQLALSAMYKKGQGTPVDENLANQWQKTATESMKGTPLAAEKNAAEWLSNRKIETIAANGYQLKGIFSDWTNPDALKENNYNQSPQMDILTREVLYKPKFLMTNPNEIAISEFYDALATTLGNISGSEEVAFPRYALDASLASLDQTKDKARIDALEGRADLGDTTAQFSMGQLYEHGIGVNQNLETAMKYYEQGSAQQDLRAEYNLGMVYLEGKGIPADYQKAISLLRDAAFKGNDYAQFVLARISEQGYRNPAGEIAIQPNAEQALAMYELASVNDYGPAQYRLAEMLVREKPADMSVATKQKRSAIIKKLYEGAFAAGVEQAALPLAYFNAMDADKAKQAQAVDVAKKGADAGNVGAALLLGLLYARGIAVENNPDEALKWYEKASLNPVGAFILGTYLSQGMGIDKDLQKGKSLLEQAANAGFSYANLNLAVLKHQAGEVFLPELEKALALGNSTAGLLLADYYLSEANDDKQMQQARDIYQHFADKGDKDGQLKLGFMLDKGLGGSVDIANAQKWYGLAAEQGQVVAQYLLGNLYQLGRLSVQPDYAEAKKWYSSAQSSYAPAAVALAFIYDTVDDDYQHAFLGYQKAAEKHDPIGEFNLGLMYEKGKGLPADFLKAKEWYEAAAQQGHRQAMVQLAGLYFNGLVGARDDEKAYEWYQKAAALGDRDALYQLGLLSETGVATTLDFTKALHYYQQSADKGNAKAKLALARMYQYGIGVPKDLQQAAKYYKELALLGNAYAEYQLATFYYEGIEDGKRMPEKGKQLLQSADENGSLQARRALQWLSAQSENRTSFIEPLAMRQMPALASRPVDLMYFDALNDWNRGDELSSRRTLDQIMTQFPNYIPAKRAYEQLTSQLNPKGTVS